MQPLAATSLDVKCASRFEVKHVSGMGGRSPPRGGADAAAANQLFLTGSDDEVDHDEQGGAGILDDDELQKPSKRQKVGQSRTVSCLHGKI